MSAYNICKVVRPTERSTLALYNGNISVINFGQKRSEGLCQRKFPFTPTGIETATLRLVAGTPK